MAAATAVFPASLAPTTRLSRSGSNTISPVAYASFDLRRGKEPDVEVLGHRHGVPDSVDRVRILAHMSHRQLVIERCQVGRHAGIVSLMCARYTSMSSSQSVA